jgi:hypothetical protein
MPKDTTGMVILLIDQRVQLARVWVARLTANHPNLYLIDGIT